MCMSGVGRGWLGGGGGGRRNKMANSVDPDETARNEPSNLDLHVYTCYGFAND